MWLMTEARSRGRRADAGIEVTLVLTNQQIAARISSAPDVRVSIENNILNLDSTLKNGARPSNNASRSQWNSRRSAAPLHTK
jgi:hypothetical protein